MIPLLLVRLPRLLRPKVRMHRLPLDPLLYHRRVLLLLPKLVRHYRLRHLWYHLRTLHVPWCHLQHVRTAPTTTLVPLLVDEVAYVGRHLGRVSFLVSIIDQSVIFQPFLVFLRFGVFFFLFVPWRVQTPDVCSDSFVAFVFFHFWFGATVLNIDVAKVALLVLDLQGNYSLGELSDLPIDGVGWTGQFFKRNWRGVIVEDFFAYFFYLFVLFEEIKRLSLAFKVGHFFVVTF